MDHSPILAHLPNAISVARLLSCPILAWLAYQQFHNAFAALLLPALLSDFVDGWLARKLRVDSDLGATLDSVADILLVAVILYAIWPLHPDVYRNHGWVFLGVTTLITLGHIGSLLRYGRLASFHTRLIRTGIFVFSIFAIVLFWYGFVPWLLYLAAFACTLGGLEHFAMLALLPEWKPDISGGLPEALRLRRENRKRGLVE